MIRFTTPTFTLGVDGSNFINLKNLYVSIAQGANIITHSLDDDCVQVSEDGILTITLTQEETGSFRPGHVNIQMRGITVNGEAWASKVYAEPVEDVIYEGVLDG